MCLNLNKEQSTLKPNYYSGIYISFVPCGNIEKYGEFYGFDYKIDDECIDDEDELDAYLGIGDWSYYSTFLYYN